MSEYEPASTSEASSLQGDDSHMEVALPQSPQRGGSWNNIKPVLDQWQDFFNSLPPWTYVEEQYEQIIASAKQKGRLIETLGELAKSDRYFLLTRILRRPDARGPVVYKLARMVEHEPDENLDLWAREHYKTSLITFAGTIQEIAKNPEITIGIFSFTKPIAKSFLKQIMRELETNELLKKIFPQIFHNDPKRESRKKGFSWSADFGITVKRKGNQKEATVEAWGLTDGQPTSKHFDLRIYNDIVTRDTVRTDGAIANTNDAWELSLNLSSGEEARSWYEGTIYSNRDTYALIRDRRAAKIRIFPVTEDRSETGVPTMYSKKWVKGKRRMMGAYNFSAQMLLAPQRAGAMNFAESWLQYWPCARFNHLNLFILVDPAKSKKSSADYTAIAVIGLGPDHNKYVVDMYRDRFTLNERTNLLFTLHNKYRPIMTYYEEYGLQTDIEHIHGVMDQRNYRFALEKVGGSMAKHDRIMRLQPDLENGVWFFPQSLMKRSQSGDRYDVINEFINKEYNEWPLPTHDDMLDVLSRIYDIPLMFPDKDTVRGEWEEVEEIFVEDRQWNPLKASGRW